jgi:HTH-type transcriptional regulator/antitoxin HigA
MSASALKIDYTNQKTKHEFHIPVSVLKKPANAKEYAKLEKILDEIIDEVRGNEKHPLAIVMDIIGDNLEHYDNEHFPPIGKDVSDIEIVRFLMDSHQLKQIDLAEIFGGQANVSKFLNGERALSKTQISGLKKLFKVSADCFLR